MVPDSSCVLCIWVVVVFVLTRLRIVGRPTVKGSPVVLPMDMDRRVCRTVVGEPDNSLSALAHLECWTRLLPVVCVQVRSWEIRVYLFLGRLDFDFVIVDDSARDIILVGTACC